MTLEDLTDEVLDIVNRKNASTVYKTYASRAVEAALIKLYQKNKTNPVHFPNEENLLRITRGNAYRHYYKIDGEL